MYRLAMFMTGAVPKLMISFSKAVIFPHYYGTLTSFKF